MFVRNLNKRLNSIIYFRLYYLFALYANWSESKVGASCAGYDVPLDELLKALHNDWCECNW